MTTPTQEKLFTTHQVADLVGIPASRLYKYRHRGEIDHIKPEKRHRSGGKGGLCLVWTVEQVSQLAEWLDNKPITKTELIGIEVDHFSKFYPLSEAIKIIADEYGSDRSTVRAMWVAWSQNQGKSGAAA